MTTNDGLAAALVAAAGEYPRIEADETNPHYNSKFVSLGHLIAETRQVLARHGLAIVQSPIHVDGRPALETTIYHESGEYRSSTMLLILDGANMQKLGSALTYARRYAWAAALGISEEKDDDGETASKPAAKPEPKPAAKTEPLLATQKQVPNIWRLIDKLDKAGVIPRDQTLEAMGKEYGTEDPKELTKAQATNLIDRLKKRAGETEAEDIPFGAPSEPLSSGSTSSGSG
jgi:ERF superfamily